jgi:Lon protease-like protein
VVYPGEELHLHIFEPRYKQLIQDSAAAGEPFGIPTVLDQKVTELGTLVRLRAITEVHENGEMDIITDGLQVIQLVGPLRLAPKKLYSGAAVEHPVDDPAGDRRLMRDIIRAIRQLHDLLQIKKTFAKLDAELWSFDVAHHAGLSLREEYQLLGLRREEEREEFLQQHLRKILPVAREMEKLRERVKLNGHFIRGEAGI